MALGRTANERHPKVPRKPGTRYARCMVAVTGRTCLAVCA